MKKILIIACALLLWGCDNSTGEQVIPTSNPGMRNPVFLFEVDGIRVYKFADDGRSVYFTSTPGRTEYTRTYRVGKVTHTEKVQTLCE